MKKRFLDHVSNNKVLGVYKINYDALNVRDEKLFRSKLKKLLPVIMNLLQIKMAIISGMQQNHLQTQGMASMT